MNWKRGRLPLTCVLVGACAAATACAGAAALPAQVALPEPGTETRSLAERRGLDVQHYDLRIDLPDIAARRLRGRATLHIALTGGLREIPLDFVGLTVDSVFVDGGAAPYRHDGPVLRIEPPATADPGALRVVVFYHGTPMDGLFFGSDAAGRPTVFADNWPNRARWWFPSNDHPSDKATVRFTVGLPPGPEAIANGRLEEILVVEELDGPLQDWTWSTDVPIPSYTMVIGVADFGEAVLGAAACGLAPAVPDACVDVSTWALEGDSVFAIDRFRRAPDMLDYYTELVGPFPYEKLAHVESSTRFGGMENASAIFYSMPAWSAGTMGEGVIAHETAHQWFGDSVTPADWSHLWLSEGFASYLDPLYYQARDGEAAFRALMEENRLEVIGSDAVDHPMVFDTTDLYWLLNDNNYEKGAWVLHMLRREIGDQAFFRAIREYYARHRDGNAETEDLRRVMEEVSGRELGWFFQQWVYSPGYPDLLLEWWIEERAGDRVAMIRATQRQPAEWPTYRLSFDIRLVGPDGATGDSVHATVLDRRETLDIPPSPGYEIVGIRPDLDDHLVKLEVRRIQP